MQLLLTPHFPLLRQSQTSIVHLLQYFVSGILAAHIRVMVPSAIQSEVVVANVLRLIGTRAHQLRLALVMKD